MACGLLFALRRYVMFKRGVFLGILIAVSTTGALLAQKTAAELSKDRRGALDAAFKKWEIATVDAQPACGEAKMAVEGDFNGDGLPDAAALIKTPTGVYF